MPAARTSCVWASTTPPPTALMGEKSIQAAVDLMQGKALAETQVDTGVSVVTKDNVDQFED